MQLKLEITAFSWHSQKNLATAAASLDKNKRWHSHWLGALSRTWKKQGDQQKGLYSLLSVWTGCFKACQGLKSGEEPGLQLLSEQVVTESLKNEEMILDIRSTGHSI